MELSIKIDNIDDFYRECEIVEENGNKEAWAFQSKRDDSDFKGLHLKKILSSKYSYKEGLDQLKELDLDFSLGGSKREYKWNSDDGDDMSTERLQDSMPFMRKRIKNLGDGNGKFITLNVAFGAIWWVKYSHMLYRAYTVVRIVDLLESQGYRVEVIGHELCNNLGMYKGEFIDRFKLDITLKKAGDPLIKGLLLTCLSPWMFRHWVFKLECAKLYTSEGMGSMGDDKIASTKDTIYINWQECLNEEGADDKINEIKTLFELRDEDKYID